MIERQRDVTVIQKKNHGISIAARLQGRATQACEVLMSTYQAASGAGAPGMAELEDGVTAALKA